MWQRTTAIDSEKESCLTRKLNGCRQVAKRLKHSYFPGSGVGWSLLRRFDVKGVVGMGSNVASGLAQSSPPPYASTLPHTPALTQSSRACGFPHASRHCSGPSTLSNDQHLPAPLAIVKTLRHSSSKLFLECNLFHPEILRCRRSTILGRDWRRLLQDHVTRRIPLRHEGAISLLPKLQVEKHAGMRRAHAVPMSLWRRCATLPIAVCNPLALTSGSVSLPPFHSVHSQWAGY